MILHQQKTTDYYSVGTKEDLVISNSFLSTLNPEQGGSPQKALAFFDRDSEKVESRSLENGTVLHKYAEKPQEFGIAAVPRPSETLGDLSDEFHRLLTTKPDLSAIPTEIVSTLKTDKGRATNVLEIRDAFEKLQLSLNIKTIEETIRAFRTARANVAAYKTYGEAVVIDSILNKSIDYIKQLDQLKDKVLLSLADKEKIESCIASLRGNLLTNELLGLSMSFDTNIILKEWDIYFNAGRYGKVKARVDNIYVDFIKHTIFVIDLKTTAKPISLFKNTVEHYRYYRQLALYVKAVKEAIATKQLFESVDPTTGYVAPTDIYDIVGTFNIVPIIIGVETTGNYDSCVFNLEAYMEKGRAELTSLCKRFAYHRDKNMWIMSMEQAENNGIINLIPDGDVTGTVLNT